MRARRAGLAALLAAFIYAVSIAAAPLFSQPNMPPVATTGRTGGAVSGVALAAPAASSGAGAQNAGGTGANQNSVSIDPDGSSGINEDQCTSADAGFGWITCPIFDRITHFLGGAAKDLMQQFLAVQPLQMSGPIYQTWAGIRLLANVMFVIIFLVLIFAHVLQFEVDAYAIKTMFPKIVAAVVLVQFSYVLTSLLVDVGNILGAGVGSIIGSVTANGGAASAQSFTGVVGVIISNLTVGLAGTALVALAVVNVALAGPVFIILLIGAIGFVVTLAVRYFLIGLLIVASPLAFAAWVLPNTEAYFGRWLSTFVKLILMYPIIMALLSVAGDVGGLVPVAVNGSGVAGTTTTAIGSTIIRVLAAAAAFAAVPQTFKWAGGAMALAADGVSKGTRALAGAKWNSSGTQVARARAERNRLKVAEKIDSGLHGQEGGYQWMGKIGGKNAFGEKLRSGLHSPATLLLAQTAPADRSDRQYRLGQIVDDQAKSLSYYTAASNPDNLLNVARWYYAGQRMEQAQRSGNTDAYDKALADQTTFKGALDAEGAFNLTDYTKSDVRREALFKQMAEKDFLKLPLINEVNEVARGGGRLGADARVDHAAMMRQGSKNVGTEPMLFKRMSNAANFDEIRKSDAASSIHGLNSSTIRNTFSNRNFQVAAGIHTNAQTARQAAELFEEQLGANVLARNFEAGTVDYMATDKRSTVLQMFLAHRDLFSGPGRGGQMRSAVMNQILSNPAGHTDALNDLRDAIRADAGDNPADQQAALDSARDWLGLTGAGVDWPPE